MKNFVIMFGKIFMDIFMILSTVILFLVIIFALFAGNFELAGMGFFILILTILSSLGLYLLIDIGEKLSRLMPNEKTEKEVSLEVYEQNNEFVICPNCKTEIFLKDSLSDTAKCKCCGGKYCLSTKVFKLAN